MSVGSGLFLVYLGELAWGGERGGGAQATWRPVDKKREVPGVNMGGWNSC